MTKKEKTFGFTCKEELEEFIRLESQKAYESYNPEKIIKMTENFINKGVSDFIFKCLGFDSGWSGEWRVDHCNGRMSQISDMISSSAREQASKLIELHMHTITLTQKQIKALETEYKREVMDCLYDFIRDKARTDVSNYLDSLTLADIIEKNHTLEIMRDEIVGSNDED